MSFRQEKTPMIGNTTHPINKAVLLFFLTLSSSCWAVTPMEYYNSLVAGGDDPGYRDGSFSLSHFNNPSGLAFNDTGDKLYVADSGNHRIRVIDLAQDNRVGTLSGTGSMGKLDGPATLATFHTPTKMISLPGNRLVVFDSGNSALRLIDLPSQTVSTLIEGVSVADMAYRPADNCLYYSVPERRKIDKLSLKSLAVSNFISNNPSIPSPNALYFYQDRLYVADSNSTTIFGFTFDGTLTPNPLSLPVTTGGKTGPILSLSFSDGSFYAFLKGGLLAKFTLLGSNLLKLQTPWGFLFNNQDYQGLFFMFNLSDKIPVGFLASPKEPRKFYVSSRNSIVSIKDYDFGKIRTTREGSDDGITDYKYPLKKPAGCFRILTIGSSRNSAALYLPEDPEVKFDGDLATPKAYTFSKQLELALNTESSLRNSNVHFEVLNCTYPGSSICSHACYETLDLVKKFDIDLVVGMVDWTGYTDYFTRAMTPDGIPEEEGHEGYKQKPLSERAWAPPALDIIRRCKKLKIPISEKQDAPGDEWSLFCNGDSQIQEDLKELTGYRLNLLKENLTQIKTSGGNNPQMFLYYLPNCLFPNDCLADFWKDVCDRNHLKFADFSESFNALKTSYHPTGTSHLTVYGNLLLANLLNHFLTENKLLPF